MASVSVKQKLLKVLADNVKTPYPELLTTSVLAVKLGMDEKTTRQIVKSMDGLGVIESDMEGQYVLITLKGLSLLDRIMQH